MAILAFVYPFQYHIYGYGIIIDDQLILNILERQIAQSNIALYEALCVMVVAIYCKKIKSYLPTHFVDRIMLFLSTMWLIIKS